MPAISSQWIVLFSGFYMTFSSSTTLLRSILIALPVLIISLILQVLCSVSVECDYPQGTGGLNGAWSRIKCSITCFLSMIGNRATQSSQTPPSLSLLFILLTKSSLFVWKAELEKGRQRCSIYCFTPKMTVMVGARARLKPGARKSICFSHVGSRGLK